MVEDDEDIRRYICRELASDYHTLESCNGKEALESIFNKTPDLVISDVMMPEMDGLTLCRKIKQNVNLNHIPVILLTAKTREEDNWKVGNRSRRLHDQTFPYRDIEENGRQPDPQS